MCAHRLYALLHTCVHIYICTRSRLHRYTAAATDPNIHTADTYLRGCGGAWLGGEGRPPAPCPPPGSLPVAQLLAAGRSAGSGPGPAARPGGLRPREAPGFGGRMAGAPRSPSALSLPLEGVTRPGGFSFRIFTLERWREGGWRPGYWLAVGSRCQQ